jgi:hypothetical protein
MATGADMVNGALRKLGVNPSDSAIEGQEMLDGIETMNDMLIEWENSGMVLGFAPIADPADTVRVPRGTEGAIKAQLAGRLSSDYSKQLTPALVGEMTVGMDNMLRIIMSAPDVDYPSNLPRGSGNECYDIDFDRRFFPKNKDENF